MAGSQRIPRHLRSLSSASELVVPDAGGRSERAEIRHADARIVPLLPFHPSTAYHAVLFALLGVRMDGRADGENRA